MDFCANKYLAFIAEYINRQKMFWEINVGVIGYGPKYRYSKNLGIARTVEFAFPT